MSPDEQIENAGIERLKDLARKHYLIATSPPKYETCGIYMSDMISGNSTARNEASRLFNKAYKRLMKLDASAPKIKFLPER